MQMLGMALFYCVKLLNTTVVHKFFLCKESMHFTVTYPMIGNETVIHSTAIIVIKCFHFPYSYYKVYLFSTDGFCFHDAVMFTSAC